MPGAILFELIIDGGIFNLEITGIFVGTLSIAGVACTVPGFAGTRLGASFVRVARPRPSSSQSRLGGDP